MKWSGFLTLLILVVTGLPAFGAVVAKGEGVLVTSEDVSAMLESTPSDVEPTEDALIEATVKTVLFAKEAEAVEVPCEEASDKEDFDRTLALSRCYLREALVSEGLMPGSVDSYYLAHPEFFRDKEGKRIPLNEYMRKRIRLGILKAKAPIFSRYEFERLSRKYEVKICGSDGCK